MADTSRKIQEFTDRFTSARSRADIRDLFSGDYYREVAVVDTDEGMATHRITISGTVDGINKGRIVVGVYGGDSVTVSIFNSDSRWKPWRHFPQCQAEGIYDMLSSDIAEKIA